MKYIYLNHDMLELDPQNNYSIELLNLICDRLNRIFEQAQVEFTLQEPFYESYHTLYLHNNQINEDLLGIAQTNNVFNLHENLIGQVSLRSIESEVIGLKFDINSEELINSIVNTIGHEAGHLLGLIDNDGSALMMGYSDSTMMKELSLTDQQIDIISGNHAIDPSDLDIVIDIL